MSTYITALPAVKATLCDLIERNDEIGPIQVIYGVGALNGSAEREHIAIGDTASWDWNDEDLGAKQSISDSFALNVFIRVEQEGNSQQEATERACELLTHLGAIVESSDTADALQSTGAYQLSMKPTELIELPTLEGFNAYITAQIAVDCLI